MRILIVASLLCGVVANASAASVTKDETARIARATEVVARASRPDEPGCAIGVYRSGEKLLQTAYGMADLEAGRALTPDAVFGAASITKQFTAAAAAIAAEQGYLSLDDDIRKFIVELPDYGRKITARDLVHHVNGLRDFNHLVKLTFKPDLYQDRASILRMIARQQGLNFAPRAEFSYNNTGYLLLAEVIERATKRSLQQFATETIFKPLGMKHTYFAQGAKADPLRAQPYSKSADGWRATAQENLITPGPGGLMTTLDDYRRWSSNLLGSRSPLPGGAGLLRTLRQPAVLTDGTPTAYAFGLETAPYKGNEVLSHGGSGLGYKTYAMLFPKQSLVVAAFCNNGAYADSLVMDVADVMLDVPATSASTPDGSSQLQLSDAALQSFVGVYRDPKLALPRIVSVQDGQLRMTGDVIVHTLMPAGESRFTATGVKGGFEFDRPTATNQSSPRLRQLESSLSSGSGTFDRIVVAKPDAAALQAYAGRYYSAELDTQYVIAVEGGRLVVSGGRDRQQAVAPSISLSPMVPDEFVSIENRFIAQFVRGPDTKVTRFLASAQFGWVRQVEFVRVEADEGIHAFETGLRPAVSLVGEKEVRWPLAERMAFYNVPAVSIAVIRDGKIAWTKAYGVKQASQPADPIDTQTVFSVGSLSKIGAATTVLRLVDARKLDLDRDVNSYLESWHVPPNEYTARLPVTLRGILSHSAGLNVNGFPDFLPAEPLPTVLDTLEGRAPSKTEPVRVIFTPGSRVAYSGGGTTVAQLVIAESTNESFENNARELVFEPLRMTRSTYQSPLPESYENVAKAHDREGKPVALPRGWETMPETAASGLWTTPSDYAALVVALIRSHRGETGSLLSQGLAQEMMTEVGRSRVGLGPFMNGAGMTRRFSHSGSNDSYKAWMEGHLATGNGVVIFTNGANGERLMRELRRSIAAAEGWQTTSGTVQVLRVELRQQDLNEFAGVYDVVPLRGVTDTRLDMTSAPVTYRITTDAGRISFTDARLNDLQEMIPADRTHFVLSNDADRRIEFVRDYRGRITGLVLRDGDYAVEALKKP